jgi:hypothetical protein
VRSSDLKVLFTITISTTLGPLLWQDAAQAQQARASVLRGSRHDVSRPLRDIAPVTAGRQDELEQ